MLKFLVLFISFNLIFIQTLNCKETLTFSAPQNVDLHQISFLVLQQAYRNIGYEIKVLELPNARAIQFANSGKVDGELSRIAGLARSQHNLIQIDVPINKLELAAYSNTPIPEDFTKLEFKKDIFVTERGMILATKFLEDLNLNYLPVVSFEHGIGLINIGRADWGIFPHKIDKKNVGKDQVSTKTKYKKILMSENLYHYLHNKNKYLENKLTDVLKTMQNKGEIEDIYINWLADSI